MKIVCTDGRFYEYVFPADVAVSAESVCAMMSRHVKEDGSIDCLCLDFAGSYLPLLRVEELRLASVLAATWHNIREAEMHQQASACV